jgi:hypothetical protein
LDSKLQQKIHGVMRLAIEDGKQQGLNVDDAMQLISDRLINDADPDVVAFAQHHNQYVQRLEEIDRAKRAERDEDTPLS